MSRGATQCWQAERAQMALFQLLNDIITFTKAATFKLLISN